MEVVLSMDDISFPQGEQDGHDLTWEEPHLGFGILLPLLENWVQILSQSKSTPSWQYSMMMYISEWQGKWWMYCTTLSLPLHASFKILIYELAWVSGWVLFSGGRGRGCRTCSWDWLFWQHYRGFRSFFLFHKQRRTRPAPASFRLRTSRIVGYCSCPCRFQQAIDSCSHGF